MNVRAPEERAGDLFELVRGAAAAADEQRRLPAEVSDRLAQAGLYRISLPKGLGGEGATPASQIRTIELISRANGSAGWNLMIGIENFGLLAPAMAGCSDLIRDPMTRLASSTAAFGQAEACDGGYRVSGRWQFVSGCHNAQVFAGMVHVDGVPHYAVLSPGQWRIDETWNVQGLRGSGSHDVVVEGAVVPANQIIAPIGETRGGDPLIRFPTGARLAYNKVAVALGIAQAAVDSFVELAQGKVPRFTSRKLAEQGHAQRAVAEAVARVQRARAVLLDLTETMWRRVCEEERVPAEDRACFQAACSDGVRSCTEAVDLLAEAAGTSANALDHPLERLVRDSRVVRQHLTVGSHHMEDAGRVLLGQPAQGVMLAAPGDRRS